MLRGRTRECETLDRLLDRVRAGQSDALLVHGEAGVGKTALLEYAGERARGCRVVRAVGAQSEMELAFAALHQLCRPMLDRLPGLPAPQAGALRMAFGLSEGAAPDRFLIGLAALGLFSAVATERPLVCLIDDAQWLDQATSQTLAFVARRLEAESVAMIVGQRTPTDRSEWTALRDLEVSGLPDADARTLLRSVVKGPLDERVRDRIVVETRGNPLALLELPRAFTPAEMAGGFGLPNGRDLPGTIEESFRRRLAPLADSTRVLMLIAAAEPTGDPVLVWRAAGQLGVAFDAAGPAAGAGLLDLGAHVRFRHPLVRSAVYRAASPEERRRVHGALADATDPEIDPDRCAWHRAQAAPGPDAGIAAALERSAGRAQARGGLAAAAAFLDRSVELTLDPATRARRALAAAEAKLHAGAPDAALALLGAAEAAPMDELQRARVDLLRAQIAFAVNRGSDAPPLLLKAAKRLEPLDTRLARETHLDALCAAMFVGRLATGAGLVEVARAARAAPPADEPRAVDLVLDGLALVMTDGYPAGTPILKQAVTAFRGDSVSVEERIRWGWLACHIATELWDYESLSELARRHVELARDAGALTVLPLALVWLVGVHLNAGDLPAAASLLEEIEAVSDATGTHGPPYTALALAAFQGHEDRAMELLAITTAEVVPRGEGVGLTHTEWARAFLYNGLGRYHDALDAAQEARRHPEELGAATWVLFELIEAAVRSGETRIAADALEMLSAMTSSSDTDWARGMEARSRALVSEGAVAERLYREAIDRLAATGVRGELARVHLLYGEWLRRERRRVDAREQLRAAYDMLHAMGLDGFAERARRELLATGETARKRTSDTLDDLTAQEAQIARMAAEGYTNPEIGSRLFISPRTVEWHLRKVFAKLGVDSRRELPRALPPSRRVRLSA